MIRGLCVGVLAAPGQLNMSPSGSVSTVLPLLVDCSGGQWELVSVVVQGDDLLNLALRTWVRADGEIRVGRWEDERGPKAQLAMRAKRVEIIALPEPHRPIDDDQILNEPLPISPRISRQDMN